MQAISAVARNTFREAVRDRVLFSLVFFAVAMVGAAVLFTQMSFGIGPQALINFSLTAITMLGVIIAVFLGNQLVSKEIERRTLYTLLAHPVRRSEFVLGKFSGLLSTIIVNCGLMMLAFVLALTWLLRGFSPGESSLIAAAWFIFLQLAVLTAVSLLFSCFSSPLLAAMFSLGLFVIGNFDGELRTLGQNAHSFVVKWLVVALSYVLPNFSNFNIVTAVSHFHPASAGLIALNSGYAVLYCTILLIISSAIIENKDLK